MRVPCIYGILNWVQKHLRYENFTQIFAKFSWFLLNFGDTMILCGFCADFLDFYKPHGCTVFELQIFFRNQKPCNSRPCCILKDGSMAKFPKWNCSFSCLGRFCSSILISRAIAILSLLHWMRCNIWWKVEARWLNGTLWKKLF